MNIISSWKDIYWQLGPLAAKNYAGEKLEKTNEILKYFEELKKTFTKDQIQSFQFIYNNYRLKKVGWEHRMVDGRTPFNINNYKYSTNPSSTLVRKINFHCKCAGLLLNLPEKNSLITELILKHEKSVEKWVARMEEIQKNPKQNEIFSSVNPLAIMNIYWVHSNGNFGSGMTALVLEYGVDSTHPDLEKRVVVNQTMKKDDHGTHVSGIIIARTVGVAPQASVQVIDKKDKDFDLAVSQVAQSKFPIINWSGAYESAAAMLFYSSSSLQESVDLRNKIGWWQQPFESSEINKMMQDLNLNETQQRQKLKEIAINTQNKFKEYLMEMTKNKLLIQSAGNDWKLIDENQELFDINCYSCYLEEPHIYNHTIFVVNLHADGLTPYYETNFPGDQFAEMAICAVGVNILSTVSNSHYEKMTGTSQAAPFVTGVALLLQKQFPSLTPCQIRDCLLKGATPIGLDEENRPKFIKNKDEEYESWQKARKFFGWGLLNAKGAFEQAQELKKRSFDQI